MFLVALKLSKYALFIAAAYTILIVLDLLPQSPFQSVNFIVEDMQFLRFISWLIPLDFYLITTGLWISAMASVYPLKFIMRKLNMIR